MHLYYFKHRAEWNEKNRIRREKKLALKQVQFQGVTADAQLTLTKTVQIKQLTQLEHYHQYQGSIQSFHLHLINHSNPQIHTQLHNKDQQSYLKLIKDQYKYIKVFLCEVLKQSVSKCKQYDVMNTQTMCSPQTTTFKLLCTEFRQLTLLTTCQCLVVSYVVKLCVAYQINRQNNKKGID
ncbi:Hypothetical_protein [Hexamita inflata]|uniref:Hypothetical_protein n=1 Tax=Hexamita inflata TaxID=28002 RepID=A0AA86PW94_9EUKA|nr:Hypothetical protein HINF_LOCUS33656 [Hexamita inflata]CAI9968097.1 Hypothetical protein HINF_LOCUS55742 [Hexamita inflata]